MNIIIPDVTDGFTFTNCVCISGSEKDQCQKMLVDYDYDSLGPREKEAYKQALMAMCPDGERERKVVGHRPCHKQFTLYELQFDTLDSSGGRNGNVVGCLVPPR